MPYYRRRRFYLIEGIAKFIDKTIYRFNRKKGRNLAQQVFRAELALDKEEFQEALDIINNLDEKSVKYCSKNMISRIEAIRKKCTEAYYEDNKLENQIYFKSNDPEILIFNIMNLYKSLSTYFEKKDYKTFDIINVAIQDQLKNVLELFNAKNINLQEKLNFNLKNRLSNIHNEFENFHNFGENSKYIQLAEDFLNDNINSLLEEIIKTYKSQKSG